VILVYAENAGKLRDVSARLEQAGKDTSGIGAIAAIDCSVSYIYSLWLN
jgi:hypothetical protein